MRMQDYWTTYTLHPCYSIIKCVLWKTNFVVCDTIAYFLQALYNKSLYLKPKLSWYNDIIDL
jgi:hypothetical protein